MCAHSVNGADEGTCGEGPKQISRSKLFLNRFQLLTCTFRSPYTQEKFSLCSARASSDSMAARAVQLPHRKAALGPSLLKTQGAVDIMMRAQHME